MTQGLTINPVIQTNSILSVRRPEVSDVHEETVNLDGTLWVVRKVKSSYELPRNRWEFWQSRQCESRTRAQT